jgi:gamma-glutamyltranspeptidase / glutathione hydrolase
MRLTLCLPLALLCSSLAAQRTSEPFVKQAVRGTRGAVAAGTETAAEAGMRLFHGGGNAVDAGVASVFAAAITEYSHYGFGGECPILIRTRDGNVRAIAGVGPMPKLGTAAFFRGRKLLPGEAGVTVPEKTIGMLPVTGITPAVVPGMVEAALVALREYGTKSFAEVIAPAIELADGAAVDEIRSRSLKGGAPFMQAWPTSKKVFLPGGQAPKIGDIFVQSDLAATLRSMAAAEKKALAAGKPRAAAIDAVRDSFYRGDIARRIDAFSRANAGLLRYEDMAAFRLEPEEAATMDYLGYRVYKCGFWSQGPTLLQTLSMLQGFPLSTMGYNSARYIHTITESMKLAFADRDAYYGDPKFSQVPAEVLLSKKYAVERARLIEDKASLEFRPGRTGDKPPVHPSQAPVVKVQMDDALRAKDTTCVDAIDKDGIMFSATPSGAWTPALIAGDTGIPLSQRAQSFFLIPGSPNEVAGGKRPRITLSPTLVTHGGKPFLALSTPGGDNQEQALLQVLLNVVEFGMNAEQAVEAPRFEMHHLVSSFGEHAMNPGSLVLDDRIPSAVLADLAERGHKVIARTRWASGAAPVAIRLTQNGVIEAGADPYGQRVAHAW